MNQKNRKCRNCIHNEQGVALIYALIVMAVIFALALALLYGVGQVSLMTATNRSQEDCYLQAVTLSEVLGRELTSATNGAGGIYKVATEYMPDCDSETVQESMWLETPESDSSYGQVVLRFQNGVDIPIEPPNWENKELSNQYLDLTVEVWEPKGGKESVTTRYNYCQILDDEDMKYTLYTDLYSPGTVQEYDCTFWWPNDGITPDHFEFDRYDEEGNPVTQTLEFEGQIVGMDLAEQWAGEVQKLTTQDENGQDQEVTFQLTRKRRILNFEEGEGNDAYHGQERKFTRIYTK